MSAAKPKGSKYYERVLQYRKADADHPPKVMPPFDFDVLAPANLWEAIVSKAVRAAIPILLAVARTLFPAFSFQGYHWITRKADVLDALEDHETFNVPYGIEMYDLSWSTDGKQADFLLGVDGPAHDRQRAIIGAVMLRGDETRVKAWAEAFSASLVEGSKGEIDVIGDLILRVPTEICRRYFGLDFGDSGRFAEWAMSVSAVLFADPTGLPKTRALARAGALRLNRVIDAAIDEARDQVRRNDPLIQRPYDELTLVQRLVLLAGWFEGLELKRPEIRAILLGLVVGFIPTNGLAAANMIETILKRGGDFKAARKAAVAGDYEGLEKIVLEAGRRNPALSPGQWRYATKATKIRGHKIPAGATVMVSTMSALQDRRRPEKTRPPSPDYQLMFGHDSHRCMGQYLATPIITSLFMELFRQPKLRRAAPWNGGWMKRVGYFPRQLMLRYDAVAAEQNLILCAIPLEAGADLDAVDARLAALGNPAARGTTEAPTFADALDATGIVYFASGSRVSAGDDGAPYQLVLEFNVDGPRAEAITAIARAGATWLADLLKAARPTDDRSPEKMLGDHALKLHFWPWGTTGLNFQGLPRFTVKEIDQQQRLHTEAAKALQLFLQPRGNQVRGLGRRAMQALRFVRKRLRTMPAPFDTFDAFFVQPAKDDPLSKWRPAASFWQPLWKKVLPTWFGVKLALVFLATWALLALVAAAGLSHDGVLAKALRLLDVTPEPLSQGAMWATAIFIGLLANVLSWVLVLGASYGLFLWMEAREQTDDRPPEPATLAANIAHENAPGYRQNHIIAVTTLKRGIVRRLALAIALWGIRQSLNWFRPGFVTTMGTIHFAKWFRLPGSRKLIFQSNYDGSWESYLEDFITRAHHGQTAAWGNGEGFPRSKGLINEGASDGDKFKRWVRRQQIPTAFWYSRFPMLTTQEIRTNKLIHSGLARANTDTKARAWLDLFGSAPRQHYELETTEIQSLVFRGLKRALFTACLPIRLPDTASRRADWLQNLIVNELSFGQFPTEDKAAYLALSATGLAAIVSDAREDGELLDLLAEFPGAFTVGMANRGRILGDDPPGDRDEPWLWQDAVHDGDRGGEERVADGVLMIYARTPEDLDARIVHFEGDLTAHGARRVHEPIKTVTLDDGGGIITDEDRAKSSYEHFGFRDGVSSPVIRGNEKFNPGAAPHDLVEPGEFILGYYNNQGYVAPSVLAPSASDPHQILPVASSATVFGFADFQDNPDAPFEARDFSRNGFYVVVRQMRQDKAGFEAFTAAKADELKAAFGADALKRTVGDDVTGDWVAAKMVGRWQDGRPLIGYPTHTNTFHDGPSNDFAFGRDDPRGQACPLGAHIRRVNPRDSLEPDDPLEQLITRRHSLIRRGRSYFYDRQANAYVTQRPSEDAEKGMLFVALCADLERQFELIQQTWAGFPAFHGLTNEPDPLTTRRRHAPGCPRQFTIPTASGPLVLDNMQTFIDMRGGGYFFSPSKAALAYLVELSRPDQYSIPVPGVPPAVPPP